ncbi:MAG: LamG domain-containing protein [Chthonomonas sp.]|nr:LamG domain-containing protein [Chthonomonas sp.]
MRVVLSIAALGVVALSSAELVAAFGAERTTAESVQNIRSLPHDLVGYGQGVRGSGFDFMSETATVQVADHPKLAFTESFTISLWAFPRSLPGRYSPNSQIFFRGDDRDGLDPYCLCLRKDGVWHFAINSEKGGNFIQAPATIGQWSHLVASFDAYRGRMRLYVNDELMAQSFTSETPFSGLDIQWDPGVSIGNVQRTQANRHWQPFDGLIDEILVYNDARAVPSNQAYVTRPPLSQTAPKKLGLFGDVNKSTIP